MQVQLQTPRPNRNTSSSVRRNEERQIKNSSDSPRIASDSNKPTNGVAKPRQLAKLLADRIGSQKFDMWFAHAELSIKDGSLVVCSDSPFVANWIESNFITDLRAIAAESIGPDAPVEMKVSPAAAANGNGHANGHANGKNGATAHNGSHASNGSAEVAAAPRPAKWTFRRLADFVVGPSNKMAYAAACRLAEENDPRCISPLFVHGECGVGKTHLLQGVCQRYIELTGRSQHVRYVTGEQFTNDFITAIRNNNIDAFRQKIRKLDLLAIDDVHFLSNKVRTQTEFLYTLDAIDLSGSRVVLASDNHPHHIKRFNHALVNRFLSGMVVKVDRPDRATRVELIKRLASTRGMKINDAALDLIADQCLGSVRELEGSITKLAAYKSLMDGQSANGNGHHGQNGTHHINGNGNGTQVNGHHANGEIGVMLAEQLFREQSWNSAHGVRMAGIIDAVCTRLGVTKADVVGSGRHRRVVLARGLVAYLGRELTTHSFPEIAQSLGRNNHSTIHTADQRLRRLLAENSPADLGGNDAEITLKELADQIRRSVLERRA